MAEITQYGFERETYPEVLEKIKDMIRQELGVEAQLNDDNPLGQWAAMLAKLQNENNRLAEAIWSSQRLQGAEGVYLDDIFSKNGVYRRGKQAGTGDVILEIDNTTPTNQTIPTTTQFIGNNSIVYQPVAETLLTASVAGYKLELSDITDTSYAVVLVSTVDGATQNLVFTNDGTDPSKINMMQALYSSWVNFTDGNEDRIYFDPEDNILYVGFFQSTGEFVGIKETTEFQITPNVGIKHCSVNVAATESGYYPLAANGITDITPTITGLQSVTNVISFYSGSEVESDAEYRERYFIEIAALSGSTRDGVISAVLKVDGVSKAVIYDNPTNINQPFADAFTFHVVTLGGTTPAISQAIYNSKPINVRTHGNVTYVVDTLDESTETIRHSKATQVEVDVVVDYKTLNRVPLSNSEKSEIIEAISDFFSSNKIGGILYNTQLIFTVLNSISRNRVVSVGVRVKRTEDPVGAYSNQDLVPDYTELFILRSGGVAFNQLV